MILFRFLFYPILLLSSLFLNQNANGAYVPRVYGRADPQKYLFTTETGEQHQIYRIGNVFMFGRVFLLDAQNANLLTANGNHHQYFCPQMEKLEHTHSASRKNQLVFRHTQDQNRQGSNVSPILTRDRDGSCRIKSAEGLEYPIYSCQTMNSALGREEEDLLCPQGHYFYLEESMDKTSGTMPKLITFQATNDEIQFCGQIESIGLSVFVREKTWGETLKFWNRQAETINSELVDVPVEQLDIRKHANITKNWDIYKWLFVILKRLQCNGIKIHSNSSAVSNDLKNTGFQMKLICEDMKGILVQITKGNLHNRLLSFNDLNSKMDKTIQTLKLQYGMAFGTEGGVPPAQMGNSSFISVFKHLGQLFKTKKAEFFQSELTNPAMKMRLKEYAGTLLYSLENIQNYYSQRLGPRTKAKIMVSVSIVVMVMQIISFSLGGYNFGLAVTWIIFNLTFNSGLFIPDPPRYSRGLWLAIYRDYIQEEVYDGKTDEHKAAIVGEASSSSSSPSIAAKHKNNEGGKCAVCQAELADRQKIKRLPFCKHIFHSGCIDGWVSTNHFTCPVCRQDILNGYKYKQP